MRPNIQTTYFNKDGKMTPEGFQYFDRLAKAVMELQQRLDAADVVLNDHETRIGDLEP